MKLPSTTLASAALMLVVASWSATAQPSTPLQGQPRQMNAVNARPTHSAETRQEEATGEDSEEGAPGSGTAPLWYRMLPAAQGEQEKPEAQQNFMPDLKESWEAVSREVSKLSPQQLKEAALAQVRRFRTTVAGEDKGLKVPAFLQNILSEPESRRNFAQFALGALGMAAAGLALGDASLVRELSLIAFYVAALSQFVKGGVSLAERAAAPEGKDAAQPARDDPRRLLAKLLAARLPADDKGDQQERLEEQE